MTPEIVGLICVGLLFLLMILGVPIVYSVGFSGCVSALVLYGIHGFGKLGQAAFHQLFNQSWVPLPLFVFLGCMVARTRLAEDLFYAAYCWLGSIRGGLVAAAIIGEGVLAAALGTSAATAIAVGKVAVPQFEKYNYKRGFSLGAILCGGILGPLIPPSATFIIIGIIAQLSIAELFIAGIIPGIICALMLMGTAVLLANLNPRLAPVTPRVTWREKIRAMKQVWPVLLLMAGVLGSIYFGIATPSEAAAIGCSTMIILGIALYRIPYTVILDAAREAAIINGMVLFIMVGAYWFTYVIGGSDISVYIEKSIIGTRMSPWVIIIFINILLLFLGCILDPLTITFLTIPIFMPLIKKLGFDPVWFAVVFAVNTQIGLITPPMGPDLFAIRTVFDVPSNEIWRGTLPFLGVLILFLALVVAFPELSLFLPRHMIR